MRPSQKTIVNQNLPAKNTQQADFDKYEIDGFVTNKGYQVIYETAIMCPCKTKEIDHRNTCDNCGGTGFLYCNPTRTRMLITGIAHDGKFKDAQWVDWGMIDSGSVMITSFNENKLAFMDRITIENATAHHSQVMFPVLNDDEVNYFSFVKYDIESIHFLGLFVSDDTEIKKLEEDTDYTFHDNVIEYSDIFTTFLEDNNISAPSVSIRFVHRPVFHIIDVVRESFTSTKNNVAQGQQELILPVKAIGKRAHLIQDTENYTGDRLLDNSWLPSACEAEDLPAFIRQLRYTSVTVIYNSLTNAQREALDELIDGSNDGDFILLEDGDNVEQESD